MLGSPSVLSDCPFYDQDSLATKTQAEAVSTPNADDLMLSQTIGPYVIVARVGGGGMGVVYRARDTKLGRTVALKFLPPQWSHDEDARQRFVREGRRPRQPTTRTSAPSTTSRPRPTASCSS